MVTCTYKTIEKPSEGLFKDKGSKFLAYAYPVLSEEDVKKCIDTLRKEHFSARHHCWAYKLGCSGERYRSSDDGEPSNSAGKPILGQLDSFGVTNVVIVVVRYFGGVLLGVGGLIQAYKEAAKDALLQAEIVVRVVKHRYVVTFPYDQDASVRTVLKKYNVDIVEQKFEEECTFYCDVAIDKEVHFLNMLSKIAEVKNVQ